MESMFRTWFNIVSLSLDIVWVGRWVGGCGLTLKSVEKIKSRAKVVLGGGWGSWCVGNER